MPVQLADVNFGPWLRELDSHPAKRDVLAQDRRPGAAGDHANLRAPDMHAVTVPGWLVSGQLKSDQRSLRRGLPALKRLPPDEVIFLALQRNREADSRLEGIGLVVEFVTREDEPGLDPQHVERIKTEWHQPVR